MIPTLVRLRVPEANSLKLLTLPQVWKYAGPLENGTTRFNSSGFLVYLLFVGSLMLVSLGRLSGSSMPSIGSIKSTHLVFLPGQCCCNCHGSWKRGRLPLRRARRSILSLNP